MPTLFHITHWKAGSQWVKKILDGMCPKASIQPQVGVSHFLKMPLLEGKIYPTVYVTKDQFYSITLPKDWKKFIIIRDLRDTLVSAYFSMKISHPILTDHNDKLRTTLNACNLEEGMIYLAETWLGASADIQRSWTLAGEEVIKYEDLLVNDVAILSDLLLNKCQLPVEEAKLKRVILANRFEVLTGGRKSGEEDVSCHERKGIEGDWENYFTPEIKGRFKALYGDLLVMTGYEKDMNW